jgi:hypothetical protein
VVYLSTAQQSSDVLTVTIQSRVSSQERPCGKKVNLVKLSEKGESTVVTSFEMASGDGRKSLSLKTSDISDSSQLIAIAVDSQGRTIGQSTQKELR